MKLERKADKRALDGAKLFLFTDNSVTESVFNNGTSSKKIVDLILRI